MQAGQAPAAQSRGEAGEPDAALEQVVPDTPWRWLGFDSWFAGL
jgi:hypothetical protein